MVPTPAVSSFLGIGAGPDLSEQATSSLRWGGSADPEPVVGLLAGSLWAHCPCVCPHGRWRQKSMRLFGRALLHYGKRHAISAR